MKYAAFLGLLAAGAAIAYVLTTYRRESFVPEFLDQGNVKKTTSTMKSSYAQETNHFKPTPMEDVPIDGTQTPFRVNMFNSYMN